MMLNLIKIIDIYPGRTTRGTWDTAWYINTWYTARNTARGAAGDTAGWWTASRWAASRRTARHFCVF